VSDFSVFSEPANLPGVPSPDRDEAFARILVLREGRRRAAAFARLEGPDSEGISSRSGRKRFEAI